MKQIIGLKEWDVYTKIRARIWLQKNCEALTDENVDLEVERIRANKGGFLSEQDVIASLERGRRCGSPTIFVSFLVFSCMCHFNSISTSSGWNA